MTRTGFAFSTPIRVRYSEIDGQKIVFNARYLDYADVAATEFWRWADIGSAAPKWRDMEFNIVRTTIEYKAPFRFDDMIAAWVRIERIGTSSMTMKIELCDPETGALHTAIEMVSVHVDLATRRSTPLPKAVVDAIAALPQG